MNKNFYKPVALALLATATLGVFFVTAVSSAQAAPLEYEAWLPEAKGKFGQRMIMRRFEAFARAAQATPAQKARIDAARDKVLRAIESQRGGPGARKQLAQIFESNQFDAGRMQAIRQQQEAKNKIIGDAMIEALREVHAVLSPAQRQAVAQTLKSGHRGRRGARLSAPDDSAVPIDPSAPPAPPAQPEL